MFRYEGLFDRADRDDSNTINFKEFRKVVCNKHLGFSTAEARYGHLYPVCHRHGTDHSRA